MSGAGIITPWLAIPLGALLMGLVAWHAASIENSKEPTSRKRIRIMNGWVMLVCIPLLVAGFSLINPDSRPRLFAMVWLGASSLILLCVALAVADALNTLRLGAAARRKLSQRLARRRDEGEASDGR